MEVTPTTSAMSTQSITCGGSDGHGLQMKTVKVRMVEESQLNNEVLEEQNGENFLHKGIRSNEENEENDDNFPTEIKVTITNKLLENTEAKTEEEENTPQKETAKGAAIKQENEMRKRKLYETYMEKLNLQVEVLHNLKNVREQDPKDEEFLDVLEFLELECICQDQDHHHHSSEEDAEGNDEGPLHVEDLLQANSVHDGEEEEEVPPEKTRCNKDSNELESSDEAAEELEEA